MKLPAATIDPPAALVADQINPDRFPLAARAILKPPTGIDLARCTGAVFDIETRPQALDKLRESMPAFDPAEVKCGNLKDEAKIKEKIDAARRQHEANYIDRAALSPLTGEVCAVGIGLRLPSFAVEAPEGNGKSYCEPTGGEAWSHFILLGDEGELLNQWWLAAEAMTVLRKEPIPFAGHNIHSFDLPFIVNRSRIVTVVKADGIRTNYRWNPIFVDTMKEWTFGGYNEFISLDTLARALGVGQKTGDGSQFHRLLEIDRQQAIEYLCTDLNLTAGVAEKLGVF